MGTFTALHVFERDRFDGEDGRIPFSGLTLANGTLFGSTFRGGTSDLGTLYAIAPDGSDYRILHHFSGEDGHKPYHKPLVVGDRTYGITKFGGDADEGVLFEIGLDGSDFRVLHHFAKTTTNAAGPNAGPILVGDRLYGTSFHGGSFRRPGAIYSFDLKTEAFEIVYSFEPTQSRHPTGRLLAIDGYLYGTASDFFAKGRFNRGSIFRVRPDGTEYETLYRFQGKADSGYPYDELAFDGDRFLYGTAYGIPDDPGDSGSLYRFDIPSAQLEVLHSFERPQVEGSKPNGSVAIAPDGRLYAATHGSNALGGQDSGTLFTMQPDGSEFEVLHRFTGGDAGDTPMRSPILANDILYGVTAFGGGTQQDKPNFPPGYGLIYAFALPTV